MSTFSDTAALLPGSTPSTTATSSFPIPDINITDMEQKMQASASAAAAGDPWSLSEANIIEHLFNAAWNSRLPSPPNPSSLFDNSNLYLAHGISSGYDYRSLQSRLG